MSIKIVVMNLNYFNFSNKVVTLPVESEYDFVCMDLSPNGCKLIAVNEIGQAHIIDLISLTFDNSLRFGGRVHCVKFSPNGKYFAVCKENNGTLLKIKIMFRP